MDNKENIKLIQEDLEKYFKLGLLEKRYNPHKKEYEYRLKVVKGD